MKNLINRILSQLWLRMIGSVGIVCFHKHHAISKIYVDGYILTFDQRIGRTKPIYFNCENARNIDWKSPVVRRDILKQAIECGYQPIYLVMTPTSGGGHYEVAIHELAEG